MLDASVRSTTALPVITRSSRTDSNSRDPNAVPRLSRSDSVLSDWLHGVPLLPPGCLTPSPSSLSPGSEPVGVDLYRSYQ